MHLPRRVANNLFWRLVHCACNRGARQRKRRTSSLIRAFGEKVLDLAGQGLSHGPAHSAVGQEGGAVGSAMAMRGSDQINGSHRAHHQFLAKALAYVTPEGINPEQSFGETLRTLSKRTLSEILGLSEGFCQGRGGSMHLRWAESGNLGTNAIVGGGVPMAAFLGLTVWYLGDSFNNLYGSKVI